MADSDFEEWEVTRAEILGSLEKLRRSFNSETEKDLIVGVLNMVLLQLRSKEREHIEDPLWSEHRRRVELLLGWARRRAQRSDVDAGMLTEDIKHLESVIINIA